MKFALAILFSLSCYALHAQGLDTLQLPKTKLDSLKKIESQKVDSAFRQVDNYTNKVDSIIRSPLQSGNHIKDQLKKKALTRIDSLKERNPDVSRGSIQNDIQNRIRQKTDSVGAIQKIKTLQPGTPAIPDYSKITDSLNIKTPGIDQLKPAQLQAGQDKINEVNSKVNDVNSSVGENVNKPLGKVNEAMGNLSKEAGGEGNLPQNLEVNTGSLDLPKTDVNSKINSEMSNLKTPDVRNVTNDIQKPLNDVTGDLSRKKTGLTGDLTDQKNKLTGEAGDLKGKVNDKVDDLNPKDKIDKVKSSSEFQKVKDGQQDVLKDVNKAKGYTQDAKNISKGDIDKVSTVKSDITKKISEQKELTSATKDLQLADEQKKQLLALKQKDDFRKQTVARAREVVSKQFAAQEKQIASTVQKISQYETKLGTIHSKIKDLPARPRREKRPPLIERFVPGITTQVQKTNNWMVDLTPGMRFRVRSIFSVGAGWNERIVFSNSFKTFPAQRIFGPRAISELSIKKGLWLKADVERMNAFVPLVYNQPDQGSRKWVWSFFGGLRKDFSIASGLRGNVQFMYNLYDPHKTSPYLTRFNVRFGFEVPIKKPKTGPAH